MKTIPLFPLDTVFFPEALLNLRIFERRYLDMVSDCLKRSEGFGVCLISHGQEVGGTAETFPVGTYGEIVDWGREEDGLLQVTVRGRRRFRILHRSVSRTGLIEVDIDFLDDHHGSRLVARHSPLAAILEELIQRHFPQYNGEPGRFDDANWISYRLAECLPLPLFRKQQLLEMNAPGERLDHLARLLHARTANGE